MPRDRFGFDDLPARPARPRASGLTLVLDKGLSVRQAEDLLQTSADYVDGVKLGWGTAVLTPRLEDKLAAYRSAQVPVCFGGTLFEAYCLRGRLDEYRALLCALRVDYVEISDGTISLPHEEKLAHIRSFAEDFRVLSEVGSKDPSTALSPDAWVRMIRDELGAGSWKVICEARESGAAGVFDASGQVRSSVMDEIVRRIDVRRLVFEAPRKAQQAWFIRKFGANVNLGNIPPGEVIPLETLRTGLRGDTLLSFFDPPASSGTHA